MSTLATPTAWSALRAQSSQTIFDNGNGVSVTSMTSTRGTRMTVVRWPIPHLLVKDKERNDALVLCKGLGSNLDRIPFLAGEIWINDVAHDTNGYPISVASVNPNEVTCFTPSELTRMSAPEQSEGEERDLMGALRSLGPIEKLRLQSIWTKTMLGGSAKPLFLVFEDEPDDQQVMSSFFDPVVTHHITSSF